MGIQDEKNVILGEATKDITFSNKKTFGSEEEAAREFPRSVAKLFAVDRWSDLPGITSRFELHDTNGARKLSARPQVGDHIKIVLPGLPLAHWVRVTDVQEEDRTAEFTTSPSSDPTSEEPGIKHFFIKEATSKFRVDLMLDTIEAHELGRNEGINNKGEEAGNRKLINTLIAEGGWAGFQKLQWEKVTNYLVHTIEID
jgi:hypothetical protein